MTYVPEAHLGPRKAGATILRRLASRGGRGLWPGRPGAGREVSQVGARAPEAAAPREMAPLRTSGKTAVSDREAAPVMAPVMAPTGGGAPAQTRAAMRPGPDPRPERRAAPSLAAAASLASPAPGAEEQEGAGFYGRYGKRMLDVTLILLALPFLLPLMAVLVLWVRGDGGPAFYRQSRLGRGGRVFQFWKLRSMVWDAEARLQAHLAADPEARIEWELYQKLRCDPRVTGKGRLLRKSSIDELPQLWNVLRGDMSLVGPRPMLPEQRALYTGRAYFRLRPGLTGLWQVSARNDSPFAARAAFDEAYAAELSLRGDLRLLRRTVTTLLRRTGH